MRKTEKVQTEEPKEKKPRGRPIIYDVGTISKPKDPEYFKKYYNNVVRPKREAKKAEQTPPTPELHINDNI